METKTSKNINLKINTELLVDYLDAVITDQMIMNSFIRDIEIIKERPDDIVISTKTTESYEILKQQYFKNLEDAAKNVYSKPMKVKLVIGNDVVDKYSEAKSKNINSKYTFDNYVVQPFNTEAVKMSKTVVNSPGKYSPIFVNSPSGLGKTHLLHALGNEMDKNGFSVCYIEPNIFTKKITGFSKMGGDTISKYIEELSNYDVLLFDDIQNMGDRAVTLKVLFQLINIFIENDKQIIIASDKTPNELTGFESRFITRFNSGLKTTIKQPSTESLMAILEFKLNEEKLSPEKWEREALRFIARNNSSSIRSIEGAVKRVSFYIEDENNIKYTYTVIQNIFKELSINTDELTPARIISVVAKYYKITKGDITSKSRKANIVIARHMAIWMIRKILDLPFKNIGKLFGGRDHSTIISSIKTIDKKISINKMVKIAAEKIERNIKSIS